MSNIFILSCLHKIFRDKIEGVKIEHEIVTDSSLDSVQQHSTSSKTRKYSKMNMLLEFNLFFLNDL